MAVILGQLWPLPRTEIQVVGATLKDDVLTIMDSNGEEHSEALVNNQASVQLKQGSYNVCIHLPEDLQGKPPVTTTKQGSTCFVKSFMTTTKPITLDVQDRVYQVVVRLKGPTSLASAKYVIASQTDPTFRQVGNLDEASTSISLKKGNYEICVDAPDRIQGVLPATSKSGFVCRPLPITSASTEFAIETKEQPAVTQIRVTGLSNLAGRKFLVLQEGGVLLGGSLTDNRSPIASLEPGKYDICVAAAPGFEATDPIDDKNGYMCITKSLTGNPADMTLKFTEKPKI